MMPQKESMHRTWLSVALLSGAAFLSLALGQRFLPDLVRAPDLFLSVLIEPYQTYGLVRASLAITALGDVAGIIAIALGSMVFLRNHPRYIRMLLVALAGSTLAANGTKLLVSRMRPDTLLWLSPFLSFSFPSGHATASMALFGFLAVSCMRLVPPGRGRTLGIAACVLAILLVGASRILLGAHFLSDVIGGWLLGLFWVALVFAFVKRSR